MKVKELIEKLSTYDENLDILLDDKLVDNLLDIKDVNIIHTYDDNFVTISADHKEDEILRG